jgi:hypothetical protein
MPKALFTKTITNVYQYEVDVDDISIYEDKENDLYDTFPPATLVDTLWTIDVEEVNE